MYSEYLWLLLIPYAALMILVLSKHLFKVWVFIFSWLSTIAGIWVVHYLLYYTNLFPPDPAKAFTPVDEITRDVEYMWLVKYFTGQVAPVVALVLAGMCWGIAWLLVTVLRNRGN